MNRPNVLLAHLNSNGDCLYATVIARQIKEVDHPGCHLTWAISTRCKQTILLNPHVDEIWEIDTQTSLATEAEWNSFVEKAEARKRNGEFDHIFYTQIIGKNIINIDGLTRSSIYNNYPLPITVPMQPIIRLSEKEVSNVQSFAAANRLSSFKNIVLVECGPDSFRSSLNPASSTQFAHDFAAAHPDTAFILSSNKKIAATSAQVIDASSLSFRENAELTKHCTFFIGCSSGISWLGTTDWAKPLPRIIITISSTNFTHSMVQDHEYANLPTNDIIEFTQRSETMKDMAACLTEALYDSFTSARARWNHPVRTKPYKAIYFLSRVSFKKRDFKTPLLAYRRNVQRKGFSGRELLYLLKAYAKLPVYLFKNRKKK
jgi:hypothetical protein